MSRLLIEWWYFRYKTSIKDKRNRTFSVVMLQMVQFVLDIVQFVVLNQKFMFASQSIVTMTCDFLPKFVKTASTFSAVNMLDMNCPSQIFDILEYNNRAF